MHKTLGGKLTSAVWHVSIRLKDIIPFFLDIMQKSRF